MSHNRKKIKKFIICLDYELGQGSVGKVYLCFLQNQPDFPIAVKIIDKKAIAHDPYLGTALKRELAVHKKLKNQNIVEMFDFQETKNNFYIFQEFCEGKTLREMMNKNKFSQKQCLLCGMQIVNGFSELVNKGVIHRDLKPQNILVTAGKLKICDFGYSKMTYTQTQLAESLVGSPAYMAPQILQGKKYSSKCDVWSFGIILYELLYGFYPWGQRKRTAAGLLTDILTAPLTFPEDESVSQEMKKFIQQCLKMQEKLRLSWLQIFQHPIFEGHFSQTASYFRSNMTKAASMLDELANRVNVVELVGAFLQFRVKALDYSHFSLIIKWDKFLPEANESQIGFMYEMFDKDCNGVIDIDEFVKAFQICDKNIPMLLNELIEEGLTSIELKDEYMYNQACSSKNYSEQIKSITWQILNAITFEDS